MTRSRRRAWIVAAMAAIAALLAGCGSSGSSSSSASSSSSGSASGSATSPVGRQVAGPDRRVAVAVGRFLGRWPGVRARVPAVGGRHQQGRRADGPPGQARHRVRRSSPAQVVTNYQKLISSDHDQLVFGPFSTLLTVPSSKVVNRFGYAFVEGARRSAGRVRQRPEEHLRREPAGQGRASSRSLTTSPRCRPRSGQKTAAYATSDDPFTEPQIPVARSILEAAGIKTVYNKVFPAEVTDYAPIATSVASSNAEVMVLGSVDVPTVSAFIHTFIQQHYNPKAFIATAGPDQGAAFLKAIGGPQNADGSDGSERLVPRLRQRRQPEDGQRVRRQVRRQRLGCERRRRPRRIRSARPSRRRSPPPTASITRRSSPTSTAE